MRIVLHIGAWKTGSSAIQQFMVNSAEKLRAQGVVMPSSAVNARGRSEILRQLSGSDEQATPLLAEIESLRLGGATTLVLSNEHYWPLAENQIQNIGARLTAITEEVEVLIYLRPQEDMWRSLHSQQAKKFYVKSGAALWGTADYLAPVFAERALHYHQTLQLFANVFGADAVSARLYDRNSFVGGDVVADFVSWLGLDPDDFEREQRDINRSVGWKGVAFAIWLADTIHAEMKTLNPDKETGVVYIRTVKRTAEQFDDSDWIGKAADPLTTSDKRSIREVYESDNQRLFATYFGGAQVFPPPGEGRGDPVSPDAIPINELNAAKRRFLRLAAKLDYNVEGIKEWFMPQQRPTDRKRWLNLSRFRVQKS